jgi:hypothetical protein
MFLPCDALKLHRDQPSNLAPCIFCERRDQKSTAMERSAQQGVSAIALSKERMAICQPKEPCQVCKLLAGFASVLPESSETARVSEQQPPRRLLLLARLDN